MDRHYPLTKDGFTLLVMGFTGKKALQFKLRYIAAFNEMQAQLEKHVLALPDFRNPAVTARAWAEKYEGN